MGFITRFFYLVVGEDLWSDGRRIWSLCSGLHGQWLSWFLLWSDWWTIIIAASLAVTTVTTSSSFGLRSATFNRLGVLWQVGTSTFRRVSTPLNHANLSKVTLRLNTSVQTCVAWLLRVNLTRALTSSTIGSQWHSTCLAVGFMARSSTF